MGRQWCDFLLSLFLIFDQPGNAFNNTGKKRKENNNKIG